MQNAMEVGTEPTPTHVLLESLDDDVLAERAGQYLAAAKAFWKARAYCLVPALLGW
jgi:hypothetical protein